VIEDVAAIVEVTLVGTRPVVRRLISIPYSLPLNRFHSVLRLVMGWEEGEAHLFVAEDLVAGDPNEIAGLADAPEEESELIVEDLLPFIAAEALYYYDLTKEWRHRLRLVDFDAWPGTDKISLLKASGGYPVNGGRRPAKIKTGKKLSNAGEKAKAVTASVDVAAINNELVRLSKRWRRNRRAAPKNCSLEMIRLDTGLIRAGYLADLQKVRHSILMVEDELARHESQDEPEFRRCLNLEYGARFSILRELQQEIDWLTARLALVQKLMQHGVRPVGRAYFQALLIESGQAAYPDFPPERDEPTPQPEMVFDRETIREFISAASDESLTEEEMESLTEDVLQETGKRDLRSECKSLYRKIVSLLHPDRAGEMTPERKDLWLRAQEAYADGDVLSLRSILDRCGAGVRDHYLTCSEIIEAIAAATMQQQAIEMFRERVAREPTWNFGRLSEKKRKSRLRRVTKDLDQEEDTLNNQLAELQRECQSLEGQAQAWESQQTSATVQLDLFR
jgi:Plasmid pRiA4b ORF-3-like protein